MPRPIGPNSGYQMGIHKMGKYRYASTERMVTGKSGKPIPKHIHWGRLDDAMRFHPNEKFLFEKPSEKAKFIYPPEWDLSLIDISVQGTCVNSVDDITMSSGATLPEDTGGDIRSAEEVILVNQNRFYGATWLLEMIADRAGVRVDLMAAFNENEAVVNAILTIAMFMYTTNYNLSRLASWQALEKYPAQGTLSSPVITMLQQSITEQNRIDFLRYRAARLGSDEVLSVDSTTKTSFNGKLIDVSWGKNKEGLNLPDTLEVIAYSVVSHMPVYYRTFPGNFPDARSIELICSDMKEAGFGQFIMVTDRAYSSTKNLELFIRLGQKSIMCQKVSVGIALKQIKALGSYEFVPDGFEYSHEHDLYCSQYDVPYAIKLDNGTVVNADRLRLNLYFDPVYKSKALKQLDVSLRSVEEKLSNLVDQKMTLMTIEDVEEFEDEYDIHDFRWAIKKVPYDQDRHTNDPVRRGRKRKYDDAYVLRGFSRSTERFMNKKLTSGFRAILTLGVDMDAEETMTHYALRAEQENDFEQWKNQMPCDRERNSSEGGKAGATFIQFVGKILSAQLKYIWKHSDELRKEFNSSPAILDEMRKIRIVEYADQQKTLITPFVGKQLLVCEEMGFPVPEGCGKAYKSMRVEP